MPGRGTIRGTHHLTFCVGGAQEDYDFHVRTLGLKSVKKTVLFDGEIPIYHLYYANGAGDASTILTAFPYRQAGWMGRRGTNQCKALLLSVPVGSLGFWADRLPGAGIEHEEAELFGTHRLEFAHPTGIPYSLVGPTATTAAVRGRRRRRRARDPRRVRRRRPRSASPSRWTSSSCADGRPQAGLRRREPPVRDRHRRRPRPDPRARRGARPAAGHLDVRRGHDPSPRLRRRHGREPGRVKDWIVGLGFTDVSDVKDRGYFFSVYCRTPGGALFEFAYSRPQGFSIDEAADELGTHMCIPPHWEDRR